MRGTLLYLASRYRRSVLFEYFEQNHWIGAPEMQSLRTILALCLIATITAQTPLLEVSKSVDYFADNFFYEIARSVPGNLVSSPLSADLVLAMAAYGSQGETRSQFERVLRLPQQEAFGRAGYQSLVELLNTIKGVQLRVANKVFLSTGFAVTPYYEDLTAVHFKSKSQQLNFGNAAQAANSINKWVATQTNNLIKDIIRADSINGDTRMILANAIYFKGTWKYRFDGKTIPKEFTLGNNEKIRVPTMSIAADLKFGDIDGLNARYVEIPYANDETSMVIVLPESADGLAAVERKLNVATLNSNLLHGSENTIILELPKFKIESEIKLENVLRKLGLTDMFSNEANFSHISQSSVKVNKVIQKAIIEVNEEGSEAAVATGILVVPLIAAGPSKISKMLVNKPFNYYIKHKNIILFRGHVVDPRM